jgi:NifB/MoaA-like Fe-S oxidoreductase
MLAKEFEAKFPGYEVDVRTIRNDFFGEQITVSGLITGQDLIAQLQGDELGNALALPCNMLRSGERVFLDDITVEQVENALQATALIVKSSGQALLDAMLGFELEEEEYE